MVAPLLMCKGVEEKRKEGIVWFFPVLYILFYSIFIFNRSMRRGKLLKCLSRLESQSSFSVPSRQHIQFYANYANTSILTQMPNESEKLKGLGC